MTLVRSGLWRHLDGLGCERFALRRADDGWTLAGTILALDPEAGPVEARYVVTCGPDWRTRRARVTVALDTGERTLELERAGGRWIAGGVEQAHLAGCTDVDLEWTPSTNTIPIRRLAMPPGSASGPLRMAWVRFPSLAIEPADQEYAHVRAGRYRFSSGGGSFQADIDVDGEGLVERYQDGWERVEPAGQARRADGR